MSAKAPTKKILIVKLRAMGDTILLTSTVEALANSSGSSSGNSSISIDVLVPSIWSPLLENNPNISKILQWPDSKGIKKVLGILKMSWRIRRQKYDEIIALHAASTSAWLARLSGVKKRSVHYHGIRDKNKFSTVQIAGKGQIKPILERDADTSRALGYKINSMPNPQIFLTENERVFALEEINKGQLRPPFLAISFGASRETKKWPKENFFNLAQRWIVEKRGAVLFFMGPGDEIESMYWEDFQNSLKVAGEDFEKQFLKLEKLPLRKLATLLQVCPVFLGNDSGPKHLAAAVGAKTVTVFGPENPFEWHPYDPNEHKYLFIEKLSCRKALAPGLPEWCGISKCEDFEHQCMRLISVESVFKSCVEQL